MDKTIIRPRPGRRGREEQAQQPPERSPVDQDAKTVINIPQEPDPIKKQQVVPIFKYPLVEHAADMFSIVIRIRSYHQFDQIDTLKRQCIDGIKLYENKLRQANISLEKVQSARYCLCALIDETVLNTEWGGVSAWAGESLLSTFHKETFGGEYFYTLLDDSLLNTRANDDLLELQYLCLQLGFQGKYRLDKHGGAAIDSYLDQLYRELSALQGPIKQALSPQWQDRVANGVELRQPFPLWVIVTLFAGLMLMIYTSLNYKLDTRLTDVTKSLASAVPMSNTSVVGGQSSDQYQLLLQLLQTEIQKQILTLEETPERVRIRISSESLFDSGSKSIRSDIEPIIAKIARSLEGTRGKILITGHTDNTPIGNGEYSSNWRLSLARATQIANVMDRNATLAGRLWPEGRGEAEPIAPNTDANGRSLNRRIEIDLLLL
ncbi:type VI secretion system protein TssL, long form [Algicola sagamiensis]|uniref:type VI secretion system protein TssL, long form n=1 Tax=Algicola sagamiensis TaxID=163869 RepID=UPI00037D5321|nr:type VI secretion system protein TssL, long form [Algicola sagamiensis]